MLLKDWDDLPKRMKNMSVKKYYKILDKKRKTLFLKRVFDFTFAIITLIILLPLFIVIGIVIKLDSIGPVMFRQTRVTQYGKQFKIFKFRTMVNNAEKLGSQITIKNDTRVTKVGNVLRKFRLDEIPQLFNIITGDMTFVGTRPEIPEYVEKYSDEMIATLLLPAGVTSEASIQYKNENDLLYNTDDIGEIYVNKVLPEKMNFNLRHVESFSFMNEIKILVGTVIAVMGKDKQTDVIKMVPKERKDFEM